MRVAIVSLDWPAFSGGGVATLAHTLACGLTRSGADVRVWTRGGGRRRAALAAAPDESFAVLGLRGRSWRRRGSKHWRRGLRREMSDWPPDVVIATSWDPLAGLELELPRLAVIAHGRDITAELEEPRARARAAVLARDATWLCLTRWMVDELAARGVSRDRVVRVPAAVEGPTGACESARVAGRPVRVLSVGRLIPRKGQDVAMEAVARLGGRAQLHVVGRGPDHERLAELVGPDVRLLGHLGAAALEREWAEADMHLMPARTEPGGDTEGYGLVFLEAAARGLPSIGGRSAGAAEAIEHEGTGLLVDEPRDPAAVAAAVERLVRDEPLRRRLGAAALDRWARRGRPEHLGAAVLKAIA